MRREAPSVSARWELHRIACEHGTLAVAEVRTSGEEGHTKAVTGPPLVLLHGFTGSHRSWDEVAGLIGGPRRILAPDLPGHGESYRKGGIEAFSLEATSDVIASALGQLGVSTCTLAGYSMGGRLALYMALVHAALVDRLILESASPGIEDSRERDERRAADDELARYALDRGIEAFVDRWERNPVLAVESALDPRRRAELRRQRLSCDPVGLATSLRGMGTGSQPWLGERLQELSMPALIITGALDAKFTEIGREMAARIPHAISEVVEAAGHNIHLADPAKFAALVDHFAYVPASADGRDTARAKERSEERA